jgi:hypothetical protein
METVADVTSKVLDPTNMIGRRGSKPITNAYLSREATKGVAQAYGLNNYSLVSDRLAALQKGDLFDDGIGYFGAQESVLMAGDSLKSDIEHVRRVSSARPTDVAMARAKVGAENYAFKMERWIGKRKADLAMLTGGTKEEAMARARTHASDRLTRMGLSADEAAGVIKGLDEDGLSLIDAMYFGHRIKGYNAAKRAAREAVAAKIANRKGGVANKADIALQDTVDRTTLIGPRELTDLRAGLLREALDAGDIVAVRNAVRQYDRLAYQFLADQGDDQVLINGVREWLDEFEGGLTKELDADALSKMPDAIRNDAARGDNYVYGLRPADGDPEWRLSFYGEDTLDDAGNVVAKAGDIKGANPWIDIVGDGVEPWETKFRDPWNMRFRGSGRGARDLSPSNFVNTVERAARFMGQQITTDKIDREARRRFVERAMVKPVQKGAAAGTTGLTYKESRDLYEAVKKRALEAGTTPRGMNIGEFQQIIDGSGGAKRVGVSARDLQLLTLQSFEGNVGTVGLTQKLTGIAKTQGSDIPLMPPNILGQMAERMFPLVRFSLNPIFQLQEWVEPWVFSAARGQQARLTGGWTVDGKAVTLDQVDLIQKHMMERYRASNPESQFDMMERSLTYLHGQKAAKEAAARTDQNMLRRALSSVEGGVVSAGQRKMAAQSEMFRYFLGPMLKEQFDKINPNIWINLEREFGTKDAGKIAVRWLTEKDKWASADPRVAYHLMDASKQPTMGARAAVNLEENARVVFSSSREALNTRVIDGSLTKTEFEDTMLELGADPDYIARTWKVMQFEAKTGGVDKWWDDALPLVAGGANEIKAVRAVVKALAEVAGISEMELLSRTMQNSPMSLMHDDFISLAENDLAAYGVLLQQQKDMVKHVRVDPVTGGVTVQRVPGIASDMELLHAWQNPPASIPVEQHGNILHLEEVRFGEGGRTLFVPGGVDALNDLETPWTAWEAIVIRSQILNPNDLKDPALKHALDEKMWRGHYIDMADPSNIHAIFNNYMFAMHSAQMSLTRNEMVATRFRVSSLDDLKDLAAEGRDLRATIEASSSTADLENDLGLAYSTKVGVSHYIPLDDLPAHIKAGMLPERTTTEMVGGVPTPKKYRSTESLIRERADAASRYLRGTSAAQRAETAKIDEAHDAVRSVLPTTKARKDYHVPGALENWAIDQIAESIFKNGIDAIDGKAGAKGLTELFGVKRLASIKPEDQAALLEAAGKLQENPLDLNARAVVGQYATTWKGYDENVIFKPWNVNGAGRTPAKNVDGSPIFHGESDVFAYLKNDDVSWRGTATSANMGNSLLMAQDMVDNPDLYMRRSNYEAVSMGVSRMRPELGEPVTLDEVRNMRANPVIDQASRDLPAALRADNVPVLGQTNVIGRFEGGGEPSMVIHLDPAKATMDDIDRAGHASVIANQQDAVITTIRGSEAMARHGVTQNGRHLRITGLPVDRMDEVYEDAGSIISMGTLDDAAGSIDFSVYESMLDDDTKEAFHRLATKYGAQFTQEPAHIRWYWQNDEVQQSARGTWFNGPEDASFNAVPRGTAAGGDAAAGRATGGEGLVRPPADGGRFGAGGGYGGAPASQSLEPLDEFGERISHRTRGLSLKTGFFGTDLGDPMNFNRGVHDLHMVGDMTEWMYYVKGANGTNAEWTKWMGRLSKPKQDQINKWIAKGAPKGAGVYKWSEAVGAEISFKPGAKDRAIAESGGVAGKAAWVRRRLDEAVASTEPNKAAIGQAQRDRMGRMYRTDEEWASLFDRDIKMFGGDYQVFEETMSIRKAEAEAVPGPEADGLKRHGNGGYQWKLWDERRQIWDPETTAFATSHSMPRRDIRYYASSDDAHNVAGFFKKEGQPSVEEVGYSALDPWNTIMPQTDGSRIRGATILTDTGERIIGLTQYRNRSTFLHEITHAVVEPLLMDDSLRRVVYNDLNEVIAERNAAMIARTGELKTQVDEITNTIIDHENSLITAKSTQAAAQKEAKKAASALKVAEAEAAKLEAAVPRQQGLLSQLKKDAPAKRKEAATRKYPSDRKDALERIEAALVREQKKLDDLIASRDAATAKVEPARIISTNRDEMVASAAEDTRIIQTNLTARKAEGYALKLEYDKVATQMPEAPKFGWDAAVSEHFADEFAKWLSTGKAKNPKMRDAFAYFRNVLVRIFNWAPKDKVSPEMQKLFEDLTTPQVAERVTTANAVPFDATEEMMHAAGIQSVVDAEDAAFTNVQFRRKRSWLERSLNHPYFGIYPASYMWGKVAPEMVRALAANPFGMPIPFLSKPVKINGVEYGLHGSPFMGYSNAMRVQNSVEMQKDTDPEFSAAVNDPKNAQVWRNMMMFLPATPWDIPANFPLWQRRIAEWGLESQEEVATARAAGQEPSDITPLNVNKLGSEIVSYAFGPKATFDWLDDMAQLPKAPALGGEASEGVTPEALKVTPGGIVPVEQQLQEASAQLQNSLGQ